MPTCSVATCSAPVEHLEWCNPHYRRWKRHGDPTAGRPFRGELRAWLRDRFTNPSTQCQPFPFGLTAAGYGQVKIDGRMHLAHRVVLAWATDRDALDLPDDLATHTCDNRACCNPCHLRWGDHSTNLQERWDRR